MPSKKKKNKTVKSKVTKAKIQKKKLITVSGGQCFWLHNGPSLSNLKDLHAIIPKMTQDQFTYHANDQKNDFAAWVEFVLMDPECAHNLKKCSNKSAARLCVQKALKKYS